MNPAEIADAVSVLAAAPFDAAAFPYVFLQAYGEKDVTLRKLRDGDANKSDVPAGLLQRNRIHMATCPPGQTAGTLAALGVSLATGKHKAKFVLATDGQMIEAVRLDDGEVLACEYADLPNRFAYFLPLAGISTVKRIEENAFDIRATGRLNKLYVELLQANPGWDTDEQRRQDLNHFFARLIFCFFAEDTHIFDGGGLFTETVEQMTNRDGSDTHQVLAELFRAMDTRGEDRAASDLRPWALRFPYVNGNLFSDSTDTPRFSRIARAYLLHVGNLDWKHINPDIFGSMIQAVADDEERGALGMHYTSVPNILKVLGPLFLDDLRAKLADAGDSPIKLLNLRKRLARIRVFDPACGSGNFLVIAYKHLRQIEAEVNYLRSEKDRPSDIPLTNFRGIEIRSFAAEVARLALVIAEFQCNSLYVGDLFARKAVIPLKRRSWITCGNALRLDWSQICPPVGTGVKVAGDDLFNTPLDQAEIDFENLGGETYICGNPPYSGSVVQDDFQKAELKTVFASYTKDWKSLDYVAGWLFKAVLYGMKTPSSCAFVATKSLCQGEQVPFLWPLIFRHGAHISFAHRPFQWTNLAAHNAGVTVIVVGLQAANERIRTLFDVDEDGSTEIRQVANISPYLTSGPDLVVKSVSTTPDDRARMVRGNMANDGGNLILSPQEASSLRSAWPCTARFLRHYIGSKEFIRSLYKYCIWIEDSEIQDALLCPPIRDRVDAVRAARLNGGKQARDNALTPHKFVFAPHQSGKAIIVPRVSSEVRPYLPVGVTGGNIVISERNFVLYGASLWNLSILVSRIHLVWIATVCVRMRMDFSYSNTLGWNTFPVPPLPESSKAELTRRADDILLARESHFPATIADLYDPEKMPPDLRAAHDRNDETLEQIYIGRRFRNDTERLEKLFEMYTEMTGSAAAATKPANGVRKSPGPKRQEVDT